jgi:DNA-binding response OmpR family regulator
MTEPARILVVEDDEAIREILRLSLIDESYEVSAVPNGDLALSRLREWPPDLIVLDMMMPIMDGATFRRRQRELGLAPEAQLIVLSASRTAEPEAAQLGAAASIAKPFELDELLAVVAATLARPALSACSPQLA